MQWLRGRHPECQFRLITNDFAARAAAFMPEVEEVLPYRKFDRAGVPEWRQIVRVRRWRPDRVIGLSPSPDRKLALRTWLLGPAARADFAGAPAHAAERLAWLFGWRGGEPLQRVRLAPPRAAAGTPREVAIWVSARKPSNQPSPAQVAAIVRALRARRPHASIGVFALPAQTDNRAHTADAAAQAALASLLQAQGLELETPPMARLFAELAASASVIAPDGGIAHVAAGFGLPVVALFGDVDPAAWRPWSPRARVLQAPSRRVSDLEAAAIVDAWEGSLADPAEFP